MGIDNSNIHYQKAAKEPAPGVKRMFLPTYAWWLQPVENVFDWLKRELKNVEAHDMDERKQQVRMLLKQLQRNPSKVLRLMGNDALNHQPAAAPRR